MAYFMRAQLNDEQLRSWGWRIPFLSGILVVFAGLYLRYYCEDDVIEHDDTNTSSSTRVMNPIRAAFGRSNRRTLLSATLVPMLWSGGFYISFVWMSVFMDVLISPPVPGAFGVTSAALFLSVCMLFPLAGILSDKYGRTNIMYIGAVLMGVLSPLMVIVISKGNAVAAFFALSVMGICLSLFGAPSKYLPTSYSSMLTD